MKLTTVNKLIAEHPVFTQGGLRWDIFHADTNGLTAKGCLLRKGRRIYIIEDLYFEWLREQSSARPAA